MKFLRDRVGYKEIETLPGTPLHDLVFVNSSPCLDKKRVLELLTQIPTGRHRDTSLASEFMTYLNKNQNSEQVLCGRFETQASPGNPARQCTRAQYLALSMTEREKYTGIPDFIGANPSVMVTIPNQAFFEQADKLLSVLVARGYIPITIDHSESQPLLVAIDLLARAYGIREKIAFPALYTTQITQEQVDLVKVKNYKLTAIDITDRALAKAQAAVTAGSGADIVESFTAPRRRP